MAGFAIDRGMGSQQRKPVHVLVDCLHGDLPASHGVAIFAASAKLASVDVCMAGCAFGPHILKNRADMAAGAADLAMHTAQRVGSFFVVVEIGIRANRLPTGGCVTTLTSEFERAVGIAGAAGLGRRLREHELC